MSMRYKSLQVRIAALLFVTLIGFSQDTEKDREKDDGDEQVYDLDKGMTPPRLIHQVYPAYNPGSRGIRIVGKVVIRLIVTSKGFPKDPSIVQGLDDEVDQSALAAVKEWKFDPAKRDGMPVAVRIVVEINFRAM